MTIFVYKLISVQVQDLPWRNRDTAQASQHHNTCQDSLLLHEVLHPNFYVQQNYKTHTYRL
jgi:hypothetical protein